MEWYLYLAAAFIICVTCTFLVIHSEYEDGLFGRICLALMSFTSFILLMDVFIEGSEYGIFPTTFLLQVGMAGFLARHAYRFIRWRLCGDYQWRKAKK